MNPALAEILLKQDGNSSLDKSRQQHKHHGLMFTFDENKDQDLATQAGALRASPSIHPATEHWNDLALLSYGTDPQDHFH
jgi:hypothetical protein